MEKLWRKLTTTVAGGAIIIAIASLASRMIGLVRESLLFSTFGAGDVLDAYYAAFKIPDFIFNIVVLGALSSSFVPVFIDTWKRSHARSWLVVNTVLNYMIGILFVFIIVLWIFAGHAVSLLAPGFSPDKILLTKDMMRVMLVSVFFFGLSNIASGVLNSFKRFVAYAVAPIVYNAGIIAGILFFVPDVGPIGLAYGVILGSLLHFAVQIPSLYRVGFRYKCHIDTQLDEVRRMLTLMVPRTLGLAAAQINLFVITNIASTLAVGSVAVFNAANNLQYVPVSLFGISLAIASFPVFSEAYSNRDDHKFIESVSSGMRRILFLTIPVSVGIILLRAQIVRIVLGHGKFDWEDTVLISQALGFFAISLFAQSITPLLARSFYARQDTKTPVIVGLVSVAVNIAASVILSRLIIGGEVLGVVGLVIAFSLANLLNMLWLFTALRNRLGELDDKRLLTSLAKIAAATLVMGSAVQATKYALAPIVNMHTTVGIATQAMVATLAGMGVYIIVTLWLKCDEIELLRKRLHQIAALMKS